MTSDIWRTVQQEYHPAVRLGAVTTKLQLRNVTKATHGLYLCLLDRGMLFDLG